MNVVYIFRDVYQTDVTKDVEEEAIITTVLGFYMNGTIFWISSLNYKREG